MLTYPGGPSAAGVPMGSYGVPSYGGVPAAPMHTTNFGAPTYPGMWYAYYFLIY